MLKRSLLWIVALGLFGLIGFAVAQQKPQFSNQTGGSGRTFNASDFSFPNNKSRQNVSKPNNELTGGWVLRMNDGEVVSADLAEEFSITLNTQYGEVTVNSDQIISLRIISPKPDNKNNPLARNPAPSLPRDRTVRRDIVIATAAGDIISGRSNFESLKLKLKWGTATADASSIDFVCNRKFGVMTVVNGQDSPSYVLSTVQVDRVVTRIIEQSRASRVVVPGRLLKPAKNEAPPENIIE